MQILLIEDDDALAAHVANGLRQSGHVVTRCRDGRHGLMQVSSESYDVIVLDRMLPHVDGMKILAALRATDDETPVLLISALGDVDERVKGLRAGGDDYLPKPFAMSELLARVDVLARRKAPVVESGFLHHADIEIDTLARIVRRAGQRIELTSREFGLLVELVRNVGRVVTRSMLLERVWDYNFDPQTNIIDQHISNLRKKLEIEGRASPIQTVRGAGYMITP
ncbi:response regulator transcription factor [Novosphingobium decolorationis]|uniref:Response regulator transcription factor n=1 Tax=Novosphingobium decolorationis TaxID=2698673 RepID=A0ABX8EB38_9SPHN|nr:response regulator transcription factor [Novosphingobium decolorationis]QVM86257.1 response regulator transcription factor [Novosphingobium decolorationis]